MIPVSNAFLSFDGHFGDLEYIKNLCPVAIAFVSASDRAELTTLSNFVLGNLKPETAHRRQWFYCYVTSRSSLD